MVVVDGMGGYFVGDVVSKMVVKVMGEKWNEVEVILVVFLECEEWFIE